MFPPVELRCAKPFGNKIINPRTKNGGKGGKGVARNTDFGSGSGNYVGPSWA